MCVIMLCVCKYIYNCIHTYTHTEIIGTRKGIRLRSAAAGFETAEPTKISFLQQACHKKRKGQVRSAAHTVARPSDRTAKAREAS